MQDFSKKLSIAVREDVASWQLTNTVAHIVAYLGNKMSEPFDTGEYFTSKDGIQLPRNSQYGIVALRATKEDLKTLVRVLLTTDILWIVYVQEMIDMIDDTELEAALSSIPSGEMDILGVGMFGSKETLKELTGTLKLWK